MKQLISAVVALFATFVLIGGIVMDIKEDHERANAQKKTNEELRQRIEVLEKEIQAKVAIMENLKTQLEQNKQQQAATKQ